MINTNAILNSYNETDREYIIGTMKWMVIVQAIKAPETDEEFKKFCEETLKERDAAIQKEAEKKARKEQREKEQAEALGMTVEQYKTYKKQLAKKRKYEKEIKEAEEKIKQLEKEIARKKRYLIEM